MSHTPPDPAPNPDLDQVDAYLDGTLSPGDRDAFEARLSTDDSLRAELELARGIEASLKRSHNPATLLAPGIPRQTGTLKLSASGSGWFRRRWALAAAAAIVLLSAAGYFLYDHFDTGVRRYDAGKFYALAAEHQFVPDWVCQNDEEFKVTTRSNVGQEMLVHQDSPEKIQLVGWAYSKTYRGTPLGPKTIMLFANVDGNPVVVLVDRLANDAKVRSKSDPSLHLFRRELGSAVLYEITPRSAPAVLDLFYIPAP